MTKRLPAKLLTATVQIEFDSKDAFALHRVWSMPASEDLGRAGATSAGGTTSAEATFPGQSRGHPYGAKGACCGTDQRRTDLVGRDRL